MNDDSLNRLFASARAAGSHDTSRIELGFETRLTARMNAERTLAVWPWRLLPFFAALAVCLAWSAWSVFDDGELAIHSGLDDGAVEWAYVEGVTGNEL